MDPALDHDAIVELLGVFALDAVDPAEAATVMAHLEVCPRCRDEVAQYQQTAAMLANTGGDAPAPVWDAIAARLEQPDAVSRRFPGRRLAESGTPARRRRSRSRAARPVAALTAVAAVAAIAVLGVDVSHLDHRVNQVTAAAAAQTISASARSALLDPSAQRIALTGTGPGQPRQAEVVALGSGAAFLFNEGLPALPAAETYQLWAMIDGQPISVGVLGAHPDTVAFSLDAAQSTRAFAVTVEPAGGSVAPTRPPVASTTV